jgi:DNA-binding NarL/FixJ family response regulator
MSDNSNEDQLVTLQAADADAASVEVWVVEDNALLRDSYAAILAQSPGVRMARAFASCEYALAALRFGEPPDIVLLDIGFPGMSGVDGARAMHAVSPTTRIVMLTVHEDGDTVFNALCAGASGYLVKPSSAEAVLYAVDEIRRGGVPMSAPIARKVLELFRRFAAPARDYGLTEREVTVLQGLVNGLGQKGIAAELGLSQHTVNTHIRNIYAKLHVHSRTGAVAKALTERLL